ncbi:MAG TPA: Abi family protein [Puia sp.]
MIVILIFVATTPVKPLVPSGIKRNFDGFLFFLTYAGMDSQFFKKSLYKSAALNIDQQISLLKGKGLLIEDIQAAKQWLSHISYFRFKQYSYSFKDYKNADGNYIPGTSFEMVRGLYVFDRKLKMIVFSAIENIEISLKTQISNTLSCTHGAHWYLNADHFISEEERRKISRNARFEEEIPKNFDHGKFLKDIEREQETPTEIFLQSYKKYYDPIYPPSWMLMEMITFGTVSHMFESLKPSEEKNAILENFKLTKKQFISWLHCFSFIRNKCAHHARLVYSPVIFQPSMPQKKSRIFLAEADQVENNTLYAVLCCLQFMLSICNEQSTFSKELVQLTAAFPGINYDRLGFSGHWKEEVIWQLPSKTA